MISQLNSGSSAEAIANKRIILGTLTRGFDFKSLILELKDLKNIGIKDKRLLVYLIQNKGYLEYLELLFQIKPELSLLLNYFI